MPSARIRILPDEPIGTISPRLYGHFAEHLGRCCYGGLWVGAHSAIPNVDGFRRDVVDALKEIRAPLIRWPGGCYADHYHWRDGIGEPNARPRRIGISCGLQVEDDNSLGTHEFLRFCELVGAEPYLAGNVGSGTVQEMCDWVEYCNASIQTTLAKERAANGRREPFGVKLWGVGNENWGCGGSFDAVGYGREYRRFATMLKHVDPTAELVVCGHSPEWNRTLAGELRGHLDLVDHFSIHHYWCKGGHGEKFGESDYYSLLAEAETTETLVKDTRAILGEIDPHRRMGIALDEWGVWHADARSWGPGALGDQSCEYAQPATMRDALAAAIAFEGFHRQCNLLSMANLAQTVNVLHCPIKTQDEKMWLTPTYYAFKLHVPHIGATAMRTEVEVDCSLPNGSLAISATSSKSSDESAVTVLNRHYRDEFDVTLPFEPQSGSILDREGLCDLRIGGRVLTMPPQSMLTATRRG